ncbi:hypothetical protein SO802_015738 [Lithocarpus litseifolius]|uniref:Protein kinase domain-containing protein n=1 Tax=Lithocarpus litseifolius TaxID=425828 RepID=A0AAW2CUI8_9ROSI
MRLSENIDGVSRDPNSKSWVRVPPQILGVGASVGQKRFCGITFGDDIILDMAPNPIELPWDEVRNFTNLHFKIGDGGFGAVYKGLFRGDVVAVKIADYNRTTDPKFKQWEVDVHALS